MFKQFIATAAVIAALPAAALAATEEATLVGDASLSTTSIDALDRTFTFNKFDEQGGDRTLTGATFTFEFDYSAQLQITNTSRVTLKTDKAQDWNFGRTVYPDFDAKTYATGESVITGSEGGEETAFTFNNYDELVITGLDQIGIGETANASTSIGGTATVTFEIDAADLASYIAASGDDSVSFDVLSTADLQNPPIRWAAGGTASYGWLESALVSGSGTYTYTSNVAPVPLPGGLALLGLGIAGLGLARRKRSA
ncbi:choice-of-anchor E domain-containing protein [Paracoccaceae bacterium GXU_MW_L88]